MAELMDHVEALADQIGPRPVSTEEERQASLYIAEELTNLGLEVDIDEFTTPTGVRWPYVVAFFAVIVGTVLSGLGMFVEAISTPMFIVGFILALAGTAIFYTERSGMAFLSKRRAGGVSQNVVAKYIPSSVARERNRRKVIIAAHVDTVRAQPEASPLIVNRVPLIRKILYYDMLALPAVLFVRLLPIPWPDTLDMVLWVISLLGCVLVLAAACSIIVSRFMPYVSGGNDNASAAAVMINVATRLLDPAERERYAVEQHTDPEDLSAPVETFAPQLTGSFAPVRVHGEDAAYEAGVVPEGASVSYGEDAQGADFGYGDETDTYIGHGYAKPTEGVGGYDVDEDLAWAEHASNAGGFDAPAAEQGHEGGYTGFGPYPVRENTESVPGHADRPWEHEAQGAQEPATIRYGAEAKGAVDEDGDFSPAASGYDALGDAKIRSQREEVSGYAGLERSQRPETHEEQASGADGARARMSGLAGLTYDDLFAQETPDGAAEQARQTGFEVPGYERPTAYGEDEIPELYRSGSGTAGGRRAAQEYVERVEHVEPVGRTRRRGEDAEGAGEGERKRGAAPDETEAQVQTQDIQEAQPDEAPAESAGKPDVPLGGYWPQPGDEDLSQVASRQSAADEKAASKGTDPQGSQSERPAAGQRNARTAQRRRQQSASVPSWYTAAREKAAKDYTPSEDAEGEESVAYRSRYADVPLQGSFTNMLNAAAEAEREPEQTSQERSMEDEWLDVVKSAEKRPAETPAQRAVNARRNAEPATTRMRRAGGAAQTAQASEKAGEPFTIDMADEEIADISPDMTGAFVRPQSTRGSKSVHSHIPSIGSSSRQAEGEGADNTSGSDRKQPTARRVTDSFKPTRAVDERESIDAGLSRQEVAVQSSYASTPQAGAVAPENDPFAPHSDAAVRAQQRAVPAGMSGTFQPVKTSQGIQMPAARPGATSSFPALTGSFPALSGTIPRISADAFTQSSAGNSAAFGAAEDISAATPSMTGGIDIPDSRFHNAVENVGGFLGKLGKKKDEQPAEEGFDGWAEDEADDFGWKGGGYYKPDNSLRDAARKRAAEIRDSVISMTENDLLDKEVWFVALGASNGGGQGMKNFLELHSSELRGSLIINLEAVGSGEICYVDIEGAGKVHRSDRRLQTLIKKASKSIMGRDMKARHLDWRDTDATPAMVNGMRAISIMGFDGVAPAGWHWHTDTSSIVVEDRLDYVAKLLMNVIENS